jgi:sugar phosphate isomerase/epimerase
MPNLLISTRSDNFEDFHALARKNRVSLEVQSFAHPRILDGDWKALARKYRPLLKDLEKPVSLHGAFYETFPSTVDTKLQALVRERYLQGLEAASMLGARVVVFHAYFNPFIRHPHYTEHWVERQVDFWKELISIAADSRIVIAMENVWEPDPSPILNLLKAAPSPWFKACLDTGHVNLFSRLGVEEWVKRLGDDLDHIHLHGNYGEQDEHLSPSKGTMKFEKFFKALEALPRMPQITIEVHTLQDAQDGVDFTRRHSEKMAAA